MGHSRALKRLLPNLLLAALLVAAQASVALHGIEHDAGTPQGNVCALCIAGDHLSSACVDAARWQPQPAAPALASDSPQTAWGSGGAEHPRPRGPPLLH